MGYGVSRKFALEISDQEIFDLWYYCSFICFHLLLVQISELYWSVFFWLHIVKFEFSKFSFSWFHRPIKDCLFLRLKTEMLLKINESRDWHVIYSKFGFFGKFFTVFRKNLKVDNYSYCIKPKQDKIKSSNIVEKI